MMRDQVAAAGLKVEKLRYWNSFTFPAAILIRTMRRFFPSRKGTEFPRVGKLTNKALITAAQIETQVSNRLGVPFGLSLVGVISK